MGGGAPWGLGGGGFAPPSYIVKKCPDLAVVDPGRFFQGGGGVLCEQPSTPESSTAQQHIVMKVHV